LRVGVEADILPRSTNHGCSQEIVARWFKRSQEERHWLARPKGFRPEALFLQSRGERSQASVGPQGRISAEGCCLTQVGRFEKAAGNAPSGTSPEEIGFEKERRRESEIGGAKIYSCPSRSRGSQASDDSGEINRRAGSASGHRCRRAGR